MVKPNVTNIFTRQVLWCWLPQFPVHVGDERDMFLVPLISIHQQILKSYSSGVLDVLVTWGTEPEPGQCRP